MARLIAHGIELDLPAGWDGRIRRRDTVLNPDRFVPTGSRQPATAPMVAHAASFSMPPGVGDFGSGAVEQMRRADLFLSLVEYDADSVGTALFRRSGIPRRLRPDSFDPHALQRTLPGQAGSQSFFVEAGRPFCLYVVLGSHARRVRTVPLLNSLLAGILIR